MSVRLAVATEDFETSLRKAIALAGKAEVDGVRLNARREILAADMSATGLRQLGQYVGENRMQIAGLTCPTRHSLAAPEFLEDRIRLIRSVMDLARPLGTTAVVVPCGRIPDPERPVPPPASASATSRPANPFSFEPAGSQPGGTRSDPVREFTTLCEVASDLARYGNHVGCTLTLQLTGYAISRIQKLLDAVRSGPLQIVFDPAVAVFTDQDVVATYRDLYQWVGYVRARDGVRDTESGGTETRLGEGVVDWSEFLPTLMEADYRGWVCVERSGGDHRGTDVLEGVARVKSLLPRPPDA